MGAGFADLLGAGDGKTQAGSLSYMKSAGVAGLAAHFGIEDGLVGDDEEGVFLRMDFEDGGLGFVGVEADEFGDGFGGDVECADDIGFLSGAGALLLLLHQLVKVKHVYL